MDRAAARRRVNREMDRTAAMTADRRMPLYACHKQVRALRIADLDIHADGSATITPQEEGFAPFTTRAGWGERYGGTLNDRGVFVQYEDGFSSWSPTAVFDAGYAPVALASRLSPSDRLRALEADIAAGAFDVH